MDAIVVIDKNGKVLFVNPAAEKFWKRKRDKFIGEDFGIPIEGNDRSDISIYRPNGEPGIAEMHVIEIEWEAQMVYMATFHDISHLIRIEELEEQVESRTKDLEKANEQLKHEIKERIFAQEEVQRKEKFKGILEMAGTICHELNQPLQVLFGLSELMLMSDIKDESVISKIIKIRDQVERMSDLTQKLMGMTRYKTKRFVDGTTIIDIDNSRERRKNERYIPHKEKSIVLGFDTFHVDQLIDISRGGLAFWDTDNIPLYLLTGELSINNAVNDFELKNIPFKFLSRSEPVQPQSSNDTTKRRYRIQFGDLSSYQISQLDIFLENHTSLKTRL